MANIIDGRSLADKILAKLKVKIKDAAFTPGLAVILVGNDPASELYVKLKQEACQKTGLYFEKHLFNSLTREKEIIEKINELNKSPKIHGMLVQLPLPRHLDVDTIIQKINWQKDADGFHPFNIKNLLAGQKIIEPGLIKGIFALFKKAKAKLKEKKIVILANSDVFIEPLKFLLEKKKAKVEAKKQGEYFQDATREADIIIAAYGRPYFLKASMIKEGAIIIDIGSTLTEEGKSMGDVDTDTQEKAKSVSPVPGGVGPLTVAYLLENTFLNAEFAHKLNK